MVWPRAPKWSACDYTSKSGHQEGENNDPGGCNEQSGERRQRMDVPSLGGKKVTRTE